MNVGGRDLLGSSCRVAKGRILVSSVASRRYSMALILDPKFSVDNLLARSGEKK